MKSEEMAGVINIYRNVLILWKYIGVMKSHLFVEFFQCDAKIITFITILKILIGMKIHHIDENGSM